MNNIEPKTVCEIKKGIPCINEEGDCECCLVPRRIKPPIGCKPKWLSDSLRLAEVTGAIERYAQARLPIRIEWIEEYNALVESLKERLDHGECYSSK
jgi:hypothetical protein